MREDVKRDDMWADEERERTAFERAVEATAALNGELVQTGPSETELVVIALLMRLYDLNLALLSHFSQTQADEVYEAHMKGDHFNPKIYIPRMTPDEPVNDEQS